MLRKLGRILYAPEDGNGGASGDDNNTDDATGADDSQDSGVTFTPAQQAHIDKVIADRLTRDRERQAKTETERRAKAEGEAEATRLAEQQEWQKLAEKAQKDASDLKGQLDEKDAELRQHTLRAAFAAQADTMGLKFASPQAAADAFALADLSEIDTSDGNGAKGIGDVIKTLSTERPHLFAKEQNYDINADRGRGPGQTEDASEAKAAEIKQRFRI